MGARIFDRVAQICASSPSNGSKRKLKALKLALEKNVIIPASDPSSRLITSEAARLFGLLGL